MNATKRHPGLQPFARDHGLGLVCVQNAQKAVRASKNERVKLAEQIRETNRDAILSYLDDERRVLSPVIPTWELRVQFLEYHKKVAKLITELADLDPTADPGLGLMARVANAMDTYVRWEESILFPAIEHQLTPAELTELCELTSPIEAVRTRSTQLLHKSTAKQIPSGLPTAGCV